MAITNQPRSPLKWVGGKFQSAERIVSLFPAPGSYDRYVEPCGGAAHVFMEKLPYDHQEIYNDLDGNLVNFWRQLQMQAEEMQGRLDNHLFAREIYYEYYRSLFDGSELDPLERAIRWFYVLRGTGTGWMRKSPVGWYGGVKAGAHSFRSAVASFKDVQSRFRHVAIDNRDVLATIQRYDSPKTLFYIDPPYFGTEQYYEVSKRGFPHAEMAEALQGLQGFVALSYYPHSNIDAWYPASKWHRVTWQQHKSSDMQSDAPALATEMLITNYKVGGACSLWDMEATA